MPVGEKRRWPNTFCRYPSIVYIKKNFLSKQTRVFRRDGFLTGGQGLGTKRTEKKGVPLVLQSKSAKKNRDRDRGCYGINDRTVYFGAISINERVGT